MAKVRGCVAKVYHKDPAVQSAMLKVESSISNGRLKLLTDGGFMVNPRMKKKAAKVLMAYDSFWLKIGLETVFRMNLSPKPKGGGLVESVEEDELQLKSQLTSFIDSQFFNSTDLAKKLKKHVKKKTEILAEVAAVVLKRFLLLVVLLDKTVTTCHLPERLPLLFDPSSKIKSSADMIRQFLKGSLFGEGDTVKQLEYMGYTLTYQQGVVHEFDYRTNNLAVDFKDGIRSCKLAEVLLGKQVLERANFNTGPNAVKVYNVKLAMNTFAEYDKAVAMLEGKQIHPQDIVDGCGDTTVGYIWNIARLFQIPRLVTVSALVFEILQVKISTRSQVDTSKIDLATGYDMRLALMLTWVQTVVGQFGATAKDYRRSFADGSVLCYLVCHYLPSYMTPDSVYIAESESPKEDLTSVQSSSDSEDFDLEDDDLDLKQFGVYSGKGWMDQSTFKKHRAGILRNFDSVFSVMRSLGGIPETISPSDFEEMGPDETAVILYVSYMCGRLLQVSKEERAALTIQRMWKIYKGYADPIELIQFEMEKKKKPKKKSTEHRSSDSTFTAFEYHRRKYAESRVTVSRTSSMTEFSGFNSPALDLEEVEAAVKIQAAVRGSQARRRFVELKKAVKVLEKYQPVIRDRAAYLKEAERKRAAATAIRAHYLGHKERRSFQEKRLAAIKIQAWYRMCAQRRKYVNMKHAMDQLKAQMEEMKQMEAAIKIQASWRGFTLRRAFLEKRGAVITIQAAYRGHLARVRLARQQSAALLIQSVYRMHLERSKFGRIRSAVICIQSWTRMARARRSFVDKREAAVKVQAAWRMACSRGRFVEMRKAARVIQGAYRMHAARSRIAMRREAAVRVQSKWRSFSQRKKFLEVKSAVEVIQTCWRSCLAAQKFREMQNAAIVIQRATRVYLNKKWLDNVESRLSTILADFVTVMERTHEVVKATIILQAYTRGYLVRKQHPPTGIKEQARQKLAARKILFAFRGYEIRKRIAKREAAMETMRSWLPVIKARSEFLNKRRAAMIIQLYWRSYLDKKISAAIVIQRAWRAARAQRQLRKMKNSVQIIQKTWRGCTVRAKAPREVKRAAERLDRAYKRARSDPGKTIGAKCRDAVTTVKNNTNVEQTFLALASLEMGTMYSQKCCQDIVSSDALIPLLRVMSKTNRSSDHQAAFSRGLTILKHLCKYKGLTMKVFRANECLETLTERLYYYRDCPNLFGELLAVFRQLLSIPKHKEDILQNEPILKQLNSLWSLVARKVANERKYINRLEADKASDKSAKRATEKAFVASNQLVQLGDLFEDLELEPTDFAKYARQMTNSPNQEDKKSKKTKKKVVEPTYEDFREKATQWKPKNMIAKEKLTQLKAGGLPRESSVGAGTQQGGYVPPKVQKKLRVLSNDEKAEALEKRTNVRLMSDYQRKPKATEVDSPDRKKSSTKHRRTSSLVPDSKLPKPKRKESK